MTYSKAFFDLQVQFACRVARISGMHLEQALLDYTNLYVRFGLGRAFDQEHPVWRRYVNGLCNAADIHEWTYRFFLAGPNNIEPPSVVATFGCFSYAKPDHEYVRLHFRDAEATGRSPLDIQCVDARLDELRSMFAHIERAGQGSLRVVGTSWLYNLRAYRRLFPAAYLATARVAEARFRNMPLWGQFLDRHGAVRQDMAAVFLERLSHQTAMDDIANCFPLQALAVDAPASVFHDFYGIKRIS